MYPRNAASPPRIAVGSIYLIANGTIQTSGASVRVRPEGGSDAAGINALEYDTTSGTIFYTPDQTETDYTAFCVTIYKVNCTSASVTVVTTAESIAGKVSLGASQTAAITGDITGNLSGSVGSVTELAAALAEIKGAGWNALTDTLEAIRNRGDEAWGGEAVVSAVAIRDALGMALADLDSQLDAILAKDSGGATVNIATEGTTITSTE